VSQQDYILTYLRAGGSLTPADALKRFGCFRLAARVWDLRRAGHAIRERMVVVPGRGGKTCLVAEYSLGQMGELFARAFDWEGQT